MAVILGSLGAGFAQIFSNQTVLLLDLPTLFVLGTEVIGGSGEAGVTVGPLPAVAAGFTLYGQAVIVPLSEPVPFCTNLDFKTIKL